MDLSQIVLAAVAALFLVYLLVQVRPALSPAGRRALADARAAGKRAREAKDDAARGVALCEAGEANARAGRWINAVGYFSRALRVSPDDLGIVDRLAQALAPRPRLLASVLERRMAAAGRDVARRAQFVALAQRMIPLLSRSPRRRAQAVWLARLVELEAAALDVDGRSATQPSSTASNSPSPPATNTKPNTPSSEK